MAPKYKLTYFNIRALGEPIRFLFLYGGIEFEDKRIEIADWPKVKKNYPSGKLPILEIDGDILNQSSAICRYLARQVGLAGANDYEAMLIDAVVDTITDARLAVNGFYFENDEALKAKKKENVVKVTLPGYLKPLDKQVQANGGFFVKGKLSWADLYWAAIHETLSFMLGSDVLAGYPNLKTVVDKVYALPKIKPWIAKRPKSDL